MLMLAAIAALYNVIVFCVYAWDKLAARKGDWRVRESSLLWLAMLGGGIGALLAQRLLRHKTRKPPFKVVLPALFVVQILMATAALFGMENVLAVLQTLIPSVAAT
ncbi:hypothetical protein RNA01_33630 [Ciceribacter naphthalenivorans]|uniref:DUF1294 domain-containing protein n=3 Tax=Pseudomonadota TaxID=1224 RepID=A0A512HLV9_9HYPH|nr:hypothetical protein RNA01_33630 [Ciceribacter naphthalenivorans]